jgi:lysophospholipid acyltransferase (LPLAT)-like uncharacterized protein
MAASNSRHEIRTSRKSELIGWLAGWLMRSWALTLRIGMVDESGLLNPHRLPGPVILVLWHNRIFSLPPLWQKFANHRPRLYVLTSASNDGAALARAMAVCGHGAIRGSSSRRGALALIALKRALLAGSDVAITPDGPRGPRYCLQPGLIKLAAATGAPIIPIHVQCASAWRLKSWDRFIIPKPFSKVRIRFDAPLVVAPGLSDDGFEAERVRIESVLRAGVDGDELPTRHLPLPDSHELASHS